MSKLMKVTIAVIAMICVAVAFILPVYRANAANSLTDAGSLTNTTANLDASSIWTKQYEDQSDYPSPGRRHGTVVRYYNFAVDGGAVSTISLEKGGTTNVPDNLIIWDGYIEILQPMLPVGVTNSLGLNTATDLLTSGTHFTNAANSIVALSSIDGTAANAVKLTGTRPMNLTMTGTTAATQGVFMVVLDVYQGQ